MKKETQIVQKSLIVLVIAFAVASVAHAGLSVIADNESTTTITTQNDEEFDIVKFDELDESVQTAINGELAKKGHKVKEVHQHKESKHLKVVAVDDENAETVYHFDETGKAKE